MKRTKKLFAAVLAAALMAVTAVPAFADNNSATLTGDTKSTSFNVTGKYQAGGVSTTVYSVDITWGSMEFTYTAASQGTWDPTTHSYQNGTEGGTWSCKDSGGDTITVANHSNAGVKVTLAYTPESSYDGISGSFTGSANSNGNGNGTGTNSFADNTMTLVSAVGTQTNAAPGGTATLTLTGGSLDNNASSVKIGTVTVTLNQTT